MEKQPKVEQCKLEEGEGSKNKLHMICGFHQNRASGLVRNSPNRLDQSDTFNDPRSPARGNERTQQTGRILAVL